MEKIIKTILNEWKERKLPQVIPRQKNLLKHIKNKKITVISGFRRTGKTYLLFHLIKKILKEQVVYINFEDERIPLKTEFLSSIMPAIKQTFNKPIKILCLDEIQNIPNWSKWLRRIYDSEKIKIFVTGSSSKMSSREIPTELRGRFLEEKIFPLSFKEFLTFKKINADLKTIDYSENQKAKIILSLKEYLKFGGMPEIVLANENEKTEIIHNYYNTVIRRDIIERFKIRNEESLKALLSLVLNSTSYSISKMYNTLKSLNFEVGKSTTQKYLNYIDNSYLLHTLKLFSYKIKDQLQHPRKIYFIDTGFINTLSSKFSKNLGRLYENTVFIELKRRQLTQQEIYYWKNSQHEEVDFVIKESMKIKQLIQVCYDIDDYTTKKREIKALLKASKELKCSNLLVITEDKTGKEKIKGKIINYISLWKFLLE
ncbi:ATP-binding protein [Candidatus Woesearchaeota archaeon]|nr:ATP-binding protein [Candidatus Woesearchaeota archaeon]